MMLQISSFKSHATKFDLAIKYVKVNPGSSFIQSLLSLSPRSCMPSFKIVGPVILEKIFEGFDYILKESYKRTFSNSFFLTER